MAANFSASQKSNITSSLSHPGPREIGFMDPPVAANVLHANRLKDLSGEAKRAGIFRLADEMRTTRERRLP